jgi:hypothetical protein
MPEYSEKAQYKIAATPPKKSEKIVKKKKPKGINRRPRRLRGKGE